jgi:riboflavin kinase/FMN adenylyltransferase
MENKSLQKGVVISFGVFDGVHIGHQLLIRCMLDRAKKLDLETVVITFDPHPAQSIIGKSPPLITTLSKKVEILKSLGIDKVVVEDFNEEFSQLSPEEFVRDILIGRFNAREIIVGYDCAFGKDRAGDKRILKKLGEKFGATVDIVDPYNLKGEIVSSTRVRNAILNGDLELVNIMLGREYSISGKIVSGKGIGNKIGYATANLDTKNEVLPPSGVYAIRAIVNNKVYDGILNMGTQPTLGDGKFRIEAHLLDFNGIKLYEKEMEVFFVQKIRNERAFPSTDELVKQIKEDVINARKILKNRNCLKMSLK